MSRGLVGVREAGRRDKKQKFTTLLHHVTIDLLRDSYASLKRKAAPGVDGVTWQQYGEDWRGFSYGFRPGRSQHNALDALSVGLRRKKVGWDLIVVRYADDAVLGFEHRKETEVFLEQLRERMQRNRMR